MTDTKEMPGTRKCHRTACQKRHATWWNPSTRNWYCRDCAAAVNEGVYPQLCIPESSLPDTAHFSAADLKTIREKVTRAIGKLKDIEAIHDRDDGVALYLVDADVILNSVLQILERKEKT